MKKRRSHFSTARIDEQGNRLFMYQPHQSSGLAQKSAGLWNSEEKFSVWNKC